MALGGKLAQRGVTTAPADIWFAQRATLDAAVRNERDHDWAALKAEIAVKKERYLRNKARTPRWELAETPVGPGDEQPDVLTGLSGSHGSAEGEVFLLSGPEDFAAFPNRAVLVARTTSPAWTPLFYSASAVVTESGGPLSHGAVTARTWQARGHGCAQRPFNPEVGRSGQGRRRCGQGLPAWVG